MKFRIHYVCGLFLALCLAMGLAMGLVGCELPSDFPIELPTLPSAEAMTQTPTERPTEPPTEEITEEPIEAPTEPPHDHRTEDWVIVTPPTCEAEGRATGSCDVCGAAMETTLPQAEHTYTATVTPPTCTESGYTRYTCACGYTYDADETQPTGHDLTATVTPPTCTESGYTRYTCACGHTYDADETQPTGHDLTAAVTPPTCTESGYTRYTCACGHTYDADETQPTGHDLTAAVTPPTCTESGYTRYTCACGYTYDADETQPTGHDLTATVTPPTCTQPGFTRYTCACGHTYDADETQPTGHALTAAVTPPTCTESGYTRYTCACGYTYDADEIPSTGHADTVSVVIRPTFERDGYTLHTCRSCGHSYEDTPVRYRDIVTGAYVGNTEILMQGVDTSKWNHDYGASLEDIKSLDWAALKAAGVDFVILKAGSTNGIDPAFELDYREAKAAGLQVGAYFYAYSTTPEATLADAEMLLTWLEGKQFELPIYFDMEETSMMSLGGEWLTELCRLFLERLWEAGYYGALYTNTEWLYNLLDTDWVKENLDVWYARYTVTLPEGQEGFALTDGDFPWKDGTAYKPGEEDDRFGIWQYTDSGMVEGFRYKFDLNYAFKDYKTLMETWGLNGFSPAPQETEQL